MAECYYLDADGVMAVNTTVDGYTLNADGAWTTNGAVQTKIVDNNSYGATVDDGQSSKIQFDHCDGRPSGNIR